MKSALLFLAIASSDVNVPKNNLDTATLNNVLTVVFALAGAIAVAFIVWGGIKYTLSQGEAGEIKKAKDTIIYSLIGLVIVVVSYSIINFVIGKF